MGDLVGKRASGWTRLIVVSVTASLVMGSWTGVASADPVELSTPAKAETVVEPGTPPVDPGLMTSEPLNETPPPVPVFGDFSNDPVPTPVELPHPDVPDPKTGFDPATSVVVERTATEDIYANADGTTTVVASATPVNTESGSGDFEPTDTTLVPATVADVPAAGTTAGPVDQDPEVKADTHPLSPVFGTDAASGAMSVDSGTVSAMFTPVTPTGDAEAVTDGSEVTYTDAISGSDLVYEVTPSAVKESIVLDTAPGAAKAASWSFWLDIAGGGVPGLVANGSIEILDPAGNVVLGMPVPYVFDSAGTNGRAPADINGTYTLTQVAGRFKLTVAVDRGWLNDPARVYPVNVDPTTAGVWYDSEQSFKSDGVTIVGDGLRIGSPNDGGKLWRSVAHFNYGQWFTQDLQVLDASVNGNLTSGTANGYPTALWHANQFSYNGRGQNLAAPPFFETAVNYSSGVLTDFVQDQFQTGSNSAFYMFTGHEVGTLNTYKRLDAQMVFTFNRAVPSVTAAAPAANATQQSLEPVLTASASDPEGDQVLYVYRIGTSAATVDTNPVWASAWWTPASQVVLPPNTLLSNTTYYWRVYAADYCTAYPSTAGCGSTNTVPPAVSGIQQFTTTKAPNPISPASASPNGTIATLTPTLSVAPTTDPDNAPSTPLKYWFSVATGGDGEQGTVASSGWILATSWAVPAGYLRDGVKYTWRAWASDGSARDQGVWHANLTVDKRTGDPKSSPVDALGGLTVNLANGNLIAATGSPTTSFATSSVGFNYTYNSQATADRIGLTATYYNDTNRDQVIDGGDKQMVQRVEPTVDGRWTTESPYPAAITQEYFLARWSGFITVPATATYQFGAVHDDSAKITIGNNNTTPQYNSTCCYGTKNYQGGGIRLETGVAYPIVVEYAQVTGPAYLSAYVKRTDNQPLIAGSNSTEMILPAQWLSTGRAPALPTGWLLSTDVDGQTAYSEARISEQSITAFDTSGSPHIYTRTTGADGVAWTPPAGEHSVLSIAGPDSPTPGEVTLIDEDGSTSKFSNTGQMISYLPVDVTGNTAALTYDWTTAAKSDGSPGPARLKRVIDPVSTLQVTLEYNRTNDNCYGGVTYPTGMANAPVDMLCRITYPDGAYTLLWYNAAGQLVRLADPGAENTDFAYNNAGVISKLRTPRASDAIAASIRNNDDTASTLVGYDAETRVTSVTAVAATSGAARPAHRYTYTTPITPGGEGVTTVTEDGLTPASGFSSQVRFNDRLQGTSVTNALNVKSFTTFNGKDQLEKTTDRAGRISTTIFDKLDRPVAAYGPAPSSCFDTDRTLNSACTSTTPGSTTAYDEGLTGLHTDWFNNTTLSGAPIAKTLGLGTGATSPTAANWSTNAPTAGINADNFSARSSGYLTFPSAGQYDFTVIADDNARIWINDQLISDYWDDGAGTTHTFYIPNVTAGSVLPIKIELKEISAAAYLDLKWKKPGDSAFAAIPATIVTPGYGLITTKTSLDSGGSTPTTVTTTSYGTKPWEGLTASTTVANSSGGLTSTSTYDALRRTAATALPGGDITDPAKRTSYVYYGNTETRANPCIIGSTAVNQAGRLKTTTEPSTSTGSQVVNEAVYDIVGRLVASRTNTDPWTCTTYDARSRATTVVYPATLDNPATASVDDSVAGRTVTTNWAVSGNPLAQSVTDTGSGTQSVITTVSDLLERQVSYTDGLETVTATTYNQGGQVTSQIVTTAGGATTSTRSFTYTADGLLDVEKLDGTTIADATYTSASELASVAYGNSTTGNFTWDSSARLSGLTWAAPSAVNYTSSVTRSRAGRIITATDTDSTQPSNRITWNYGYDQAANLTSATLAARATAPAVTLGFNYTATPSTSCATGTSNTASANSNRMSMTRQLGTATAVTTSYCYDGADRILGIVGANATSYTFDSRGNVITTTTGSNTTTFVYDGAGRHVRTVAPNGSGGTVNVIYTRDALDRIMIRTVNGATDTTENGSFRCGFTTLDDSADLDLTSSNVLLTREIGLTGGALYIKNYQTSASSRWHYPNIHGDIMMSLTSAGAIDGSMRAYDPYGTPMTSTNVLDADTGPDTTPGSFDYGWLGQFQRSAEHTANLNYIEMGARIYDPTIGRFYSVDPVPGGGDNDYAYPSDPIGSKDLDGKRASGTKQTNGKNTAKGKPPKTRNSCKYNVSTCVGSTSWKKYGQNPNNFWRNLYDAAVFVINTPYTAIGAGWATLNGGSCKLRERALVVCYGTKGGFGRGGTTIGNTFVTGMTPTEVGGALAAHELVHTRQWAYFGLSFPLYYGLAGANPCKNAFEIQAGLRAGNYTRC